MKKSLIALAVLAASCFAVVPAAAQPVDDIGKAVSLSKSGKAMQMADAPVTQRGAYVFASFAPDQHRPVFIRMRHEQAGCALYGKGKDGGGKKCVTAKGPGDEDGGGGSEELTAKAKKKRSKSS